MADSANREQKFRRTGIEACEDRRIMALNVLGTPDFKLDYYVSQQADAQTTTDGQIQALNTPAHNLTGWTTARGNYGLTGRGQTVAVIDSGIAYDHLALGGGYGANYRVVGGWDFAENDANPFDDGPSGSHGTHVAGIIGSTDANSPGVAGGTDLVALRVFDDQGNGNFTWVEQALRWVINNRTAFRNEITTVNLSIGAGWNSSNVPNWAMLEDEFQQLKAAGVFISVAAGNSFGQYNTPGLDYPAASSYVVPVMSVNSDGTMSSFSQRHSRAIAAPGAGIRSTVPDYMGNMNGRTDDYASFSGTSMAAPYIAGASTLIRQAMRIAGRTTINQDTIYQHMVNTSDSFFDSATQATYRRLNLQRALEQLIPADEYGNTIAAATTHSTFTGGNNQVLAGFINTVADKDYISFTASATGSLRLNATVTGEMNTRWEVVANDSTSTASGNSVTVNVVAGQRYTIGLSTAGGVGGYSVTAAMTASVVDPGSGGSNSGGGGVVSFSPPDNTVDWGSITQRNQTGISVAGEGWYKFTASRSGTFTLETTTGSNTSLNLKVHTSTGQTLYNRNFQAANRLDLTVTQGQEYFVQLTGSASGITMRSTNLVSTSGSTVEISGTTGNDVIHLTAGASNLLTLNGVVYTFSSSQFSRLNIDAGAGNDTVTLTGGVGNDTAVLRVGNAALRGTNYTYTAVGVENVTVNGGGGTNQVQFYDSVGDDVFYANSLYAQMSGTGYLNIANGFSRVAAYASTGNDLANFNDTAGNDTLSATPTTMSLSGTGYTLSATSFDYTQVFAVYGGTDTAVFVDSAGNDLFSAGPERSILMGNGFYNLAAGFDRVSAEGRNGGWDTVYFFDSIGNDTFTQTPTTSQMQGAGYQNISSNFDFAIAYSTRGGSDIANFFDGRGADNFETERAWGRLTGAGYYGWVNGFRTINLNGSAGGSNTLTRRAAADFVLNRVGTWV